MVKFDVHLLRFLEDEDFRVLTALEMALRNHDVAPTVLIERIAGLPHGGARRRLNHMLKHKIIHHESLMYDGYAMKYQAYDFLALRTFSKRGTVLGVASRIGCGKESDIFSVQDENGNDAVLKLQRLGRCSFRSVARNRDYKGGLKKRHGASWFYLSRLAATKEFAFMKLLHDEGFPVPKPIDHNRHAIVMEHVNGTLLNNIEKMDRAQKVYEKCLALIVKLAQHGLIHGDFNEFNLFVTDNFDVIMIDFPQMVSIDHLNASELFDRDIQNLALFFDRRYGLTTKYFPKLEKDVERKAELDRSVMASGSLSIQQLKDMEMLSEENKNEEEDEEDDDDEEYDEEYEGEEGEEDEEEEEEDAEQAAIAEVLRKQQRKEQLAAANKLGNSNNTINNNKNSNSNSKKQANVSSSAAAAATTVAVVASVSSEKEQKEQQEGEGEEGEKQTKLQLESKHRQQDYISLAQLRQGTDFDFAQKQQEEGEEGGDQEQQDEEDLLERDAVQSVATTVAPVMIPKEEIKKRVQRQLQMRDDLQFRRNMHRNVQKGREKLSIKKQVKGASGSDDRGLW